MGRTQETIDDIAEELRRGIPSNMPTSIYLACLADRIEAAHSSGVVKAMDELMGKE